MNSVEFSGSEFMVFRSMQSLFPEVLHRLKEQLCQLSVGLKNKVILQPELSCANQDSLKEVEGLTGFGSNPCNKCLMSELLSILKKGEDREAET